MTNSSPPKFSPSTLFLPDPPLQLSWQMHVKKKKKEKVSKCKWSSETHSLAGSIPVLPSRSSRRGDLPWPSRTRNRAHSSSSSAHGPIEWKRKKRDPAEEGKKWSKNQKELFSLWLLLLCRMCWTGSSDKKKPHTHKKRAVRERRGCDGADWGAVGARLEEWASNYGTVRGGLGPQTPTYC